MIAIPELVPSEIPSPLGGILLASLLLWGPGLAEASDVPDPGGPGDTEVVRDVPYASDPHPEQHLDLYWPPEAPATVVFVHGGSLRESGERRTSPMYADICPTFAAAGIGCATVDYRLSPSFQWPAMAEDVAAAVEKIRELVGARGGDPGRVVLFGHSSGCQLAAVLGAKPVYLSSVSLEPRNLAGVVAMGCVLDNYDAALREVSAERIAATFERDPDERERWGSAEGWIAANPSYHLGPHMPPTLVVVAEEERFAPPILEQGARFVRRLRGFDVPADLVVVPGTHRTSIEGVGTVGDPVFEAVRTFVLDPRGAVSD